MARYLVNDIEGKDPRSLLTTAVMANMMQNGIRTHVNEFIKYTGTRQLTIEAGVVLAVGDSIFKTEQTPLTLAHLDTGTQFIKGKDYYIYICDQGSNDKNEVYKISLNSTYPNGFNANNSRKIGGFHYGDSRKINPVNLNPQNATGADWGSGWETQVSEDILRFSVWCLTHRSAGAQDGMTYIPALNSWVSIYMLSQGTDGRLISKYNETPVSGSEGYCAFDAMEMLRSSQMRPLTFQEFVVAAEGSPNGQDNNTYAWTSSGNTNRTKTGQIAYATSIYGCKDCVGLLWEAGANTIFRNDWLEPITSAPAGPKQSGFDIYQYLPFSFGVHGGGMKEATACSSRAFYADVNPWVPSSEVGFRGICDHRTAA